MNEFEVAASMGEAAPALGRIWCRGVQVEHRHPVEPDESVSRSVQRPPLGRTSSKLPPVGPLALALDAAGPEHDPVSGCDRDVALERVAVSRRFRWWAAAGRAAGIELSAVYVALLAGWLTHPRPVLMVLVVGLFVVLLGWMFLRQPPPSPVTAGARWVRTGGWGGSRVALYDLTEVTIYTVDGAPHARLVDTHAMVVLHLGLVQANPALWALVYRGIRHSLDAGGRATGSTRGQLGLPRPDRPASP